MSSTSVRLQQNDAELISDEVREIISYRPHWIIRKGNMIFLTVLCLLLALTCYIKYPDIVKGSARLVALNAPKEISAKVQGKLLKLFVTNEEMVTAGQHLGYLESTASYDEVMALRRWMETTILSTKDGNYDGLVTYPLPVFFSLGELQNPYQSFQNQLLETKQLLASGYYQKKKAALEKDLGYLASLKNDTYQQQRLSKQDQTLQENEYRAYEELAKDKVIAPLELNQYKSKLIAREQNLQQIQTQLTNSDVASHGKHKELLDLEKQVLDRRQEFHSSLLNLKSELEKWIQQYVLIAAESGKVLFITSLQENQLVGNGQSLFFIQPRQTDYYAEIMTPQKGFGKIKKGQKVRIKLESYPSEEYGYLSASVNYISGMPTRRDSFLIKVNLDQGMTTNYRREISFRNNLAAQAEVVTDDRRLIDRLLGQLKLVLER